MSSTPPDKLKVWSFHSVKGGVGKSTLALLTARRLAQSSRVALIDMDLTGTSLADVVPLLAPTWSTVGHDLTQDDLPLETAPTSWLDPSAGMRVRAAATTGSPRGVPFLNDWFMHQRDVEHARGDVNVQSIMWKARDDNNLLVIPSSAFPYDISRVLPLLYDEPFGAFVESRLEWLLDALLAVGVDHVVFDTPPTLPGLSKAVLSLALRLPDHESLAKTGSAPKRLADANTTWHAWIVTTQDTQDLRAVERWLEAVEPDDSARMLVVINRTASKYTEIREHLERVTVGAAADESAGGASVRPSPIFDGRTPVCIGRIENMGLFDVVIPRVPDDEVLQQMDQLIKGGV